MSDVLPFPKRVPGATVRVTPTSPVRHPDGTPIVAIQRSDLVAVGLSIILGALG